VRRKKMKHKIILTITVVILTSLIQKSYGAGFIPEANNSIILIDDVKNAIDYAKSIVAGEIVKVEKKFKSGIPIWEVTMISSGGGKVVIEIGYNNLKLIYISAPEGPYDYFINPGNNIVSFPDARSTAEAYTGEAVLKWVLKEYRGKWEYNFWHFTKTGRAQVRVDAETGQIITKQTKGKKK
jgi:hypothetical protein